MRSLTRDAARVAALLVLVSCAEADLATGPTANEASITPAAAVSGATADISTATTMGSYAVAGNTLPVAYISAPVKGTSVTQGVAVTFNSSASDVEDGPLSGASLVWTSSISGTLGTGRSFAKSDLAVGRHAITLTVTDSDGAVDTDATILTVVAGSNNQLPSVWVTSPAKSAVIVQGTSIAFEGDGNDPEDGDLKGASLVWTSDRDGQIGTGASYAKSNLSVGTHTLTLTGTDSKGATATHTRTLTITAPANAAPLASISTPTAAAGFSAGTNVSFSGSANDPESGALSGASLVWTSSIDGQIGTGTSFTKSNLSVGTHTITLIARDVLGAIGSAARSITIAPVAPIAAPVVNTAPSVAFVSPANGSSSLQGVTVGFSGTALDPEQGILSGASLVWTSSRDGQIGTGTSFSKSNLTVGTHTITLTAKDAGNLTASVSRTITVSTGVVAPTNTAPVAQFTYSCSALTCTFNGSSSTDNVAVTAYNWSWGDGRQNTSALNTITYAASGSYNVVLVVSDGAGLTGSITKTVTVGGTTTAPTSPTPLATAGEPAGMSFIAQRAFNCAPSKCEGGWVLEQGQAGLMQIVSDPTAPKSPGSVAQMNYLPSLPGGSGPANAELNFYGADRKKTIYVSTYFKLSSNFQSHPTSVNKMEHYFTSGVNRLYTQAMGDGTPYGTLTPAVGLQALAAPYYDGRRVTDVSVDLMPNLGSSMRIIRGQWHHQEIVLTANTPGYADGMVEMWLDGTKVLSYSGIMFNAPNRASYWEAVKWNPTWGGAGGSITSPFYMQMDDYYISGK